MNKPNKLARRLIRITLIVLIMWSPLPGYGWDHQAPITPFIHVGHSKNHPWRWSRRRMTIEERIAHQRAIEDVYWRHRLWPATNHTPKPRLEEVMPPDQIEMKVSTYLRGSEKLESYWKKPITDEMLRSEIARMTAGTKNSDVLRELWEALGNDPFVIAECLARPLLVNRASVKTQSSQSNWCAEDVWAATSAVGAPGKRYGHSVVWTGSEMIVWGGYTKNYFNTGGRYDPATDTWTPTSTVGAADARRYHVAVWTGSEMVLWGGSGPQTPFLGSGARYNPMTDTWAATATANAPNGRYAHTAVWTGNEMFVWGGNDNFQLSNTGGRYDPVSDTWRAISTPGGLEGRRYHNAVWTGNEMIVWGPDGGAGARYCAGLQ